MSLCMHRTVYGRWRGGEAVGARYLLKRPVTVYVTQMYGIGLGTTMGGVLNRKTMFQKDSWPLGPHQRSDLGWEPCRHRYHACAVRVTDGRSETVISGT
jgi:hypothetical protein